jgi:hypothetical protein
MARWRRATTIAGLAAGAGHAIILERPDVVTEEIASMVAEVQAGNGTRAPGGQRGAAGVA